MPAGCHFAAPAGNKIEKDRQRTMLYNHSEWNPVWLNTIRSATSKYIRQISKFTKNSGKVNTMANTNYMVVIQLRSIAIVRKS